METCFWALAVDWPAKRFGGFPLSVIRLGVVDNNNINDRGEEVRSICYHGTKCLMINLINQRSYTFSGSEHLPGVRETQYSPRFTFVMFVYLRQNLTASNKSTSQQQQFTFKLPPLIMRNKPDFYHSTRISSTVGVFLAQNISHVTSLLSIPFR